MYSDLSSNVKALSILNTKRKKHIGCGAWGVLGGFFSREIANGAGQDLRDHSSLIHLIIINMKN